MDHGVVHIFDDLAGDHVHPEVNYLKPDNTTELKIGENYGLFVMPSGDLWIAGGYGVGLQPWNPMPHFAWVDGHFIDAFTVYTDNHDLTVPYGYREDQRGVAVTSDQNVWFASKTNGLWSWNMSTPHNYTAVKKWAAPDDLMDLAADLDDTLWLVNSSGQLLRFDPKTNGYSVFPGLNGVRRVVLDATVIPRALYVSGSSGLSVIRAK
jgi:streptogramin lyase